MRASAVLALVFFAAACEDPGKEAFARAKSEYLRVVEERRHLSDPAFARARLLLAQVPEASRFRKQADELLERLPGADTLAPGPLTKGTAAACSVLARRLGELSGPPRAALLDEIRACERAGHAHP